METMPRRHVLVVMAIALALGAAGGVAALVIRDDGQADTHTRTAHKTQKRERVAEKKTRAQLTAANYKILKPKQTTRLLQYADAAYACMSKQLDLGKLRPLRTKIVMTLPPRATLSAVARLSARCALTIGDPPPNASFQVRGQALILYLPKYCILDKKVVALDQAP
jgi:hypothetical protein